MSKIRAKIAILEDLDVNADPSSTADASSTLSLARNDDALDRDSAAHTHEDTAAQFSRALSSSRETTSAARSDDARDRDSASKVVSDSKKKHDARSHCPHRRLPYAPRRASCPAVATSTRGAAKGVAQRGATVPMCATVSSLHPLCPRAPRRPALLAPLRPGTPCPRACP